MFIKKIISETFTIRVIVNVANVAPQNTKTRDKTKITKSESDILSYAKQFGSISLTESMEILAGISKRTVQRRLMKLVNEGYLEIEGDARSTKYTWKNK